MTKEQFLGFLELTKMDLRDLHDDLLDDAKRAGTPVEYYNKKNQALGVLQCIKSLNSDIERIDEIYDNIEFLITYGMRC